MTMTDTTTTRSPAGTRMPRIGIAHTGTGSQLTAIADPAFAPYRARSVYLPDLEPGGIDDLDVLVVADRCHPGLLREHAAELRAVAERGGVLVVMGENNAHTWLPGVRWEPRPTNFWWWRTGEDHGMRLRAASHPFWAHFDEKAMIWHQHGVFELPDGAVALSVLEEQGADAGAITYLDEASTPGVVLVTSLDPFFHHGAAFMPGATQFLYQTMRWAEDTAIARIAQREAAEG